MAHQSKTAKILAATLALIEQHNGEATTDQISIALDVRTRLNQKRLLNTLSELHLDGRICRTSMGCYGKPATEPPRDKRLVMWSLLQMRRRVDITTLVELADVSVGYAREFMCWLTAKGLATKQQLPGKIAIWTATGEHQVLPLNSEKAEKLRAMRLHKKDLLRAKLGFMAKDIKTALILLQDDEIDDAPQEDQP